MLCEIRQKHPAYFRMDFCTLFNLLHKHASLSWMLVVTFSAFISNMLTRCTGHILYVIFSMAHMQAATAIHLSRDTMRTIKGGEIYEEGYYVSRRNTKQVYYHGGSSSIGLTRLAHDEVQIYEALSNAQKCPGTHAGNTFPQIAQEYLADYEATSGALMRSQRLLNVTNKVSAAAGDLIGAYRMIRRYRNYIQLNLFRAVSSNISFCKPNLLQAMKNLPASGTMRPSTRDLHFTMFAIIFTQLQLGWKPVDILQGTIRGMELGPSLKAVHCVEIGVHAIACRLFPVGIEWLELALTKIQHGDKTMDFKFAFNLLQKSVAEHDKSWEPEAPLDLKQVFYKTRINETYVNNKCKEWPRRFEATTNLDGERYTDISWEVCSGKIRQTEVEKSELFCWLETKVHPSWTLGPLKAELLARHPFEVIQFHQVLQENTMESIKEYWGSLLETPFISYGSDSFTLKTSHSELVGIQDDRIHRITERISGLKAGNSSHAYGVSYPLGGHNALHYDNESEDSRLNLATMNYFLVQPDVGGETKFPAAKALAKPIKGSAVLFYTRLRSSELDLNTKHGSCPVVQGTKWIGTSWVDYDRQVHLKCDLDKNSKMEYLVNGKSKYKAR